MSANPPDSSIRDDTTLVIFCRRPATGIGKPEVAAPAIAGLRLAGALGDRATLQLAGHLLATALEDAGAWPGPVIIAPARAGDAGWAAGLLPGSATVLPQPAGNLGERITGVDETARALGHSCLVYVGSDAPALTPDYFRRARAALIDHD
ncbi:MAG: DUF2064 domain-containing protein, partial [Gammaproteobacteria bacterium]